MQVVEYRSLDGVDTPRAHPKLDVCNACQRVGHRLCNAWSHRHGVTPEHDLQRARPVTARHHPPAQGLSQPVTHPASRLRTMGKSQLLHSMTMKRGVS